MRCVFLPVVSVESPATNEKVPPYHDTKKLNLNPLWLGGCLTAIGVAQGLMIPVQGALKANWLAKGPVRAAQCSLTVLIASAVPPPLLSGPGGSAGAFSFHCSVA